DSPVTNDVHSDASPYLSARVVISSRDVRPASFARAQTVASAAFPGVCRASIVDSNDRPVTRTFADPPLQRPVRIKGRASGNFRGYTSVASRVPQSIRRS